MSRHLPVPFARCEVELSGIHPFFVSTYAVLGDVPILMAEWSQGLRLFYYFVNVSVSCEGFKSREEANSEKSTKLGACRSERSARLCS